MYLKRPYTHKNVNFFVAIIYNISYACMIPGTSYSRLHSYRQNALIDTTQLDLGDILITNHT